MMVGLAEVLGFCLVLPSNGATRWTARNNPAILLVVFGTSYPEAQVTYKKVKEIYQKKFPNAKVEIAFTSAFIRRTILERSNTSIDNPLTGLAHLNDEGYVNVVVQSLHMIPGEEFHDLANIVDSIKGIGGKFGFKNLVLGAPLLISVEDYQDVSHALTKLFNENTTGAERTTHFSPRNSNEMAIILMGHGTKHSADCAYSLMANMLAADHENVFLGTVEGCPGYDEVLARLKKSGVKKVRLMPFMIVAGNHALNDLSGNKVDSWKSLLEKEGFETDSNLKGLGENDEIVQIFVRHTKEVLAKFE